MYRPIVNFALFQELLGRESLLRCFSDLSHLDHFLPLLPSQFIHSKSWHLLYLLLEGQFHLFDSQVSSPPQQQRARFLSPLLFIQ